MTVFILYVALTFLLYGSGTGSNRDDEVRCLPQQVHLSFGDDLTKMVVMWSTPGNCSTTVHYGRHQWGLPNAANVTGTQVLFEKNPEGVKFLHRAVLQNLDPDTDYYYLVESNEATSEPFFFRTPKQGNAWSPEFLVFGDLGTLSESISKLKTEALKGTYTAVIHDGDFAYDMQNNLQTNAESGTKNVGDIFMQMIEEITSHVPYMTSPGNHEIFQDSFAHYRYRFSMPNSGWPIPVHKMWYSIDIGPVHFISYSSEVFFTLSGKYIKTQHDWLKADLDSANKHENRIKRPWIIAYGHRPMYCSNNNADDCTKESSLVRAGLEQLFYEKGVDIILEAHEHSYERLYPVYKGVVMSNNYTNPPAPVHLISGAAGAKGPDRFAGKTPGKWSAFSLGGDKGLNTYGRLKVYNASHVYWEQVDLMNDKVIDSIWITQTSHEPFRLDHVTPEVKQHIDQQVEKDKEITNNQINNSEHDNSIPDDNLTGSGLSSHLSPRFLIGGGIGILMIVIFFSAVIVYKCRQKPQRKYRRWETLDYGRKFYSNVNVNDKDADDFEVDVSDGRTKLLTEDGSR